jgi:putative flippase GtrA
MSRGNIGAHLAGQSATFLRFCVVGGAGYVTNLVVFWPLVHTAHMAGALAYCVAYLCGFLVALAGHRYWTFAQTDASVVGQGTRYFVVSALVLGAGVVVFEIEVAVGISQVLAQAISLAIVTPLSFGLNRFWAFRAHV